MDFIKCIICADKSGTYITVSYLLLFRDLTKCGGYAWRVVALVHMYPTLHDILDDVHVRRRTKSLRSLRVSNFIYIIIITLSLDNIRMFLLVTLVGCTKTRCEHYKDDVRRVVKEIETFVVDVDLY